MRLRRWGGDRDGEEDERRGEDHRQCERAPQHGDEHDRGEGGAGQAHARGAFGDATPKPLTRTIAVPSTVTVRRAAAARPCRRLLISRR